MFTGNLFTEMFAGVQIKSHKAYFRIFKAKVFGK